MKISCIMVSCKPPVNIGIKTHMHLLPFLILFIHLGVLLGFSRAPSRPQGCYGEDHGHRYLVLEKLDCDLTDIWKTRSLPTAEIARIGIEMLEGFKELHAKSYCFVDVKPDNFMLKDDKVFFVDYGLIEKFMDISTGRHKALETSAALQGTPTFSSLARHNGCNHGRRDDIEAMGYVLLSLRTGGTLPWSTARSLSQVYDEKRSCDIVQMSKEYGCAEVGDIIIKCRNLRFEETPNYTEYIDLLRKMQSDDGASSVHRKERVSKSPRRTPSIIASSKSATASLARTATKPLNRSEVIEISDNEEEAGPKTRGRRKSAETTNESISPLKARRKEGNTLKRLYLTVISGVHTGDEFALDFSGARRGKCLGGEEEADYSLQGDCYVSGKHALIRPGPISSTIEVKDCGSTNGIKINKVKIADSKWHQVNVDDILQVGMSKLTVELR